MVKSRMKSGSFIYVDHALERMLERGIPRERIQDVIQNPVSTYSGKAGINRKVAEKSFQGRILKVIYAEKPEGILVITAMWKGE